MHTYPHIHVTRSQDVLLMRGRVQPRLVEVEVIRETIGKILSSVKVIVPALPDSAPDTLPLRTYMTEIALGSHLIGLFLSRSSQLSVVLQRLITYLASINIGAVKYSRSGDLSIRNISTRGKRQGREQEYGEKYCQVFHPLTVYYI